MFETLQYAAEIGWVQPLAWAIVVAQVSALVLIFNRTRASVLFFGLSCRTLFMDKIDQMG